MKKIKIISCSILFIIGVGAFNLTAEAYSLNELVLESETHTCYKLQSSGSGDILAFDCSDCVQKRNDNKHTGKSTCTHN